jgi:hypothetical protein
VRGGKVSINGVPVGKSREIVFVSFVDGCNKDISGGRGEERFARILAVYILCWLFR